MQGQVPPWPPQWMAPYCFRSSLAKSAVQRTLARTAPPASARQKITRIVEKIRKVGSGEVEPNRDKTGGVRSIKFVNLRGLDLFFCGRRIIGAE